MMKKKMILLLFLIISVFTLSSCSKQEKYHKDFIYFDTTIEITIYSENSDEATSAFSYAKETLYLYDNLCNRYEEENDNAVGVYTINKEAGKEVKISKELFDLIKFSIDNSDLVLDSSSSSPFTIGIGKVSDIWHELFSNYNQASSCESPEVGALPNDYTINKTYNTDTSLIILNEDELTIKIPSDMSLDLGGVAKGYTSEIISSYFNQNGINYVINAGSSNIKTNIGNPSRKNNAYIVGLINPNYGYCSNDDNLLYAKLNVPLNKAVVTSGDYQRFFIVNGKRYFHILDAKTNMPVETDLRSITIITSDGGIGDILSTSLFMIGLDKAYEYVSNKDDLEAIFFTVNNEIYMTDGIKDLVTITDGFAVKDYQ